MTTRPATTGAFRGSRWGAAWRNTRAATGSSYADGIIEHELHYEENGFQFFAADFEPDGFDCLHDDFIGAYFTERDPQSVVSGECRGRFENGGNHCGVLKKRLTLAPDEDARLIFMLGEGGRETGRAMREKYTAARERGIKAMDSVDEYLYTDFGLMLNAPLLHQARRRHRLRHAGLPRPQRERRDIQPPEPVGVVRRGCSGARKPRNEIL